MDAAQHEAGQGGDSGDAAAPAPLFLGLDCSTQSMSAVVMNQAGEVLHETTFAFDERLPHYGTKHGVVRSPHQPGVVLVPSLMIAEALEVLLDDLDKCSGIDLQHVVAISGSAQQHSSVYWKKGFDLRATLDALDPATSLTETLKQLNPFHYSHGPSWMDTSTSAQCAVLERVIGKDELARITGSTAHHRFTGPQIIKRMEEETDFLRKVGRISLVSSMLTSLLVGAFAAIDDSDGSGMNLLDLENRSWDGKILDLVGKHGQDLNAVAMLRDLLGAEVARAFNSAGTIHPYFTKRYKLRPDCQIITFSGDNPCSLAGMGLSVTGDVGISLGTSSTLMAVIPANFSSFSPQEGHVFRNPVDPDTLMAMLCFKNGALTREAICAQRAEGSWSRFDDLFDNVPPGNNGTLGFFYMEPEITPQVENSGIVGYDAADAEINLRDTPAAVEIRALVESQFLAMRVHAAKIGLEHPKRVIVVGGASVNHSLCRTLADVFNAPVHRLQGGANTAARGAGLRAWHGWQCTHSASWVPFTPRVSTELVASPAPANVRTYTQLLPRVERLEALTAAKLKMRSANPDSFHLAIATSPLPPPPQPPPPPQRRPSLSLSSSSSPPREITMLARRLLQQHKTRLAAVARCSRSFHRGSVQAFPEIPFKLADIGEGIAEVEVLQWFVKDGDPIKQFQNVCEVQSDKATVEITSRYDGVVKKIHYKVGEMAKVGTTLIDIEVDEAVAASVQEAPAKGPGKRKPAPKPAAAAAAPTPAPKAVPKVAAPVVEVPVPVASPPKPERELGEKLLTTPSVRRLAREHNIDLEDVAGSGPQGRILKDDILAHISALAANPPPKVAVNTAPVAAPAPGSVRASYLQEDTVVSLTPIQKMMVKSMNAALQIPHFGYADEIIMDRLHALRNDLKSVAEQRGVKLSYMPFIIKAASLALKYHPELNATVSECQTQVTHIAAHNISVAMDTPTGLIVPNVKNVESKSIFEIAEDLNRLQELASAGKLGPADLTGGTFSISNIGSIGGTYMGPVIMSPQVAIGAVGRIQTLPRFDDDGQVVPVRVMNVSWSGDHRVIDGATMARFSNKWKGFLENPTSMISEMRSHEAPSKQRSGRPLERSGNAMTNLPLLQRHNQQPAQGQRPRVASEELIVPAVESVNSVYYGVDAFSPTLVDFHTVDQKRIVWSSRAHRKMMTTLHLAWYGRPWKRYSMSFWSSVFAVLAHVLFIAGCTGEMLAQDAAGQDKHLSVDDPLLLGAICYFIWHVLGYFEVINSCHNLEVWLDEYFHGTEPILTRRYVGFFPTRIDFWAETLGMLGSFLYVVSRTYVLAQGSDRKNFGVVDVGRSEFSLIVGYWLPFFVGSMLLLFGAYLAHVEEMHQWFTLRLGTVESWVTGSHLVSTFGFFVTSTLQFVDPFDAIFGFTDCMLPFAVGSVFGLCSNLLSLIELEMIHKRHKHPEYGILKNPTGYGTLA
ncbi:TPA: hypothetical protein N0F65_002415 [Lagenidium giganteum]|uniref:Lipoamide acyltransferase component of branched-chain alpha-keto acid dehydrogenase complex, mitochondrial n=1 Tax=Lagenidium giganteum TaxID=4803 RepID=A0AAV2YJM4_9STRA|nr:TPA: hypothetical protein N0F65_002415 [Lagenidium giganteum]